MESDNYSDLVSIKIKANNITGMLGMFVTVGAAG
jgi:hypothetical protein